MKHDQVTWLHSPNTDSYINESVNTWNINELHELWHVLIQLMTSWRAETWRHLCWPAEDRLYNIFIYINIKTVYDDEAFMIHQNEAEQTRLQLFWTHTVMSGGSFSVCHVTSCPVSLCCHRLSSFIDSDTAAELWMIQVWSADVTPGDEVMWLSVF